MQPRVIIQSDVDGNSESEAQGTWALGPNDCLIGLKIGQVIIYRFFTYIYVRLNHVESIDSATRMLPSIVICLSFACHLDQRESR